MNKNRVIIKGYIAVAEQIDKKQYPVISTFSLAKETAEFRFKNFKMTGLFLKVVEATLVINEKDLI